MSVFVRASLQGTPKTSPGHVALHHMPGLHEFAEPAAPQRPNAARAQASDATPPGPTFPLVSLLIPTPLEPKPAPLGLPGQARFML